MKSSRYNPEQVAFGLRQGEEGTPVSEACRKMGISEQTFRAGSNRARGGGGYCVGGRCLVRSLACAAG
jgi:putative transposase